MVYIAWAEWAWCCLYQFSWFWVSFFLFWFTSYGGRNTASGGIFPVPFPLSPSSSCRPSLPKIQLFSEVFTQSTKRWTYKVYALNSSSITGWPMLLAIGKSCITSCRRLQENKIFVYSSRFKHKYLSSQYIYFLIKEAKDALLCQMVCFTSSSMISASSNRGGFLEFWPAKESFGEHKKPF